jgi:NAD-dependent deacetylase
MGKGRNSICGITQNIDGLHQDAGSKKIFFELHGSVQRNYCLDCHSFIPWNTLWMRQIVKECGLCSQCGGIIKPDVVLYEEGLDGQVIDCAVKEIAEADVMIVGGTSLVVYPAAGLAHGFRGDKLILINKGATPLDGRS